MSKYDAFVVALTEEQKNDIFSITHSVGPGESIIAQVYFDGLRVKLLNKDQVDAIRTIMGVDYADEFNSAIQSQLAALRRLN